MNRLQLVILLVSTPLLLAQTAAPPNPVTAHYHAYRVALAANDLATAETEAAAALDASVARDGQGGVTAVLATNLAQLRLTRGETDAAYAPAQQAFTIASANPQAGVDPLLTRLLVGRAELTDAHAGQARTALPGAIQEALPRPDLNADAYKAATDLGQWLFSHNDYRDAVPIWAVAGQLASTAPGDHSYIEAQAKISEGVSRFMLASIQQHIQANQPEQTHIHISNFDEYVAADSALGTAEEQLQSAAHVIAPGAGVTLAQQAYATAMAWRAALHAFLASSDQIPADTNANHEAVGMAAEGGASSECDITVGDDPHPQFPPGARDSGTSGAVVVRFEFNERGERTDTRVISAVPGVWFEDAVARVAPQWRIAPAPGSPADCRPAPIMFYPIIFYFR